MFDETEEEHSQNDLTDKRKGRLCRSRPHQTSGECYLVLLLSVDMPALISKGKLYPWPRPRRCPCCGGVRLWGHGYVSRYFDQMNEPLWIKRWRCADCGAVHTLRPDTHWRRFWAAANLILMCLRGKIHCGRWRGDVSRQSQQYWWRGYRIQSLVDGSPAAELAVLLENRIMAATHSITDRAIQLLEPTPYPSLAATGPPGAS